MSTIPNASSFYQSPSVPDAYLQSSQVVSLQAEDVLNRFRTYCATVFPFVYVSPHITVQEFEKSQPFLWLCIKAVLSLSTTQQKVLGFRVRETVSQRMLLANERSLDLLLGLLVYLGMANPSMQNYKSYFSLFSQLAQALVFDLGLNKSITADQNQRPVDPGQIHLSGFKCPMQICGFFVSLGLKSPGARVRTMEERRAVLGCYYVTSTIVGYKQRIDGLRWTSHMAESLQIMADKPEYSQDTILVLLIRTRLIADKAGQLSRHDHSFHSPEPPPIFLMRALDSELQETQRDISSRGKHDIPHAIRLSVSHTQLIIWENSLCGSSTSSDQLAPELTRIEGLYKCLEAVKSWFDITSALPAADYGRGPFPLFPALTHFLFILHKLSTLKEPGWNRELVRTTIDMSEVLQTLAQKLEQVSAECICDSPDDSIFDKVVAFVKIMKEIIDARSSMTPDPQAGNIAPFATHTIEKEQKEDALKFPMDFANDAWLTELLATM
ncbi:hypothetical protein EYZ11_004566 [Aspergillus tanneri]|uniref:Transcription factor domain-containing protein n=1 Tax=Aspergillus tanneri TaxID=1220188 RepID=A0A4S3JK62_9EURO|nr:hypothetical protein EYZ11_004566 [Aspergillus tanneri]